MKSYFYIVVVVLIISTNLFSQSAVVTLRPQYIDISATTSESAVLMTVSSYTANTYRYRLYNGSNQYYCWDAGSNTYISNNSYASGPLIPGGSITGASWWIVFQRGSNNAVAATYRDRAGASYNSNYQTFALPTATSMSSAFTLSGTVTSAGGNDLTVKYVILGFDAVSGGNLLCATSSTITTGTYALKCNGGLAVKRIEVRTLLNTTINTITNTSGWTANTTIDNLPLPVELVSFSAQARESEVKLYWKTASEVNNYGFTVQRSSDSVQWQNRGFIRGAGNSNAANTYSFVDNLVVSGRYFYRLIQTDNDGSAQIYNTIAVSISKPVKLALEQNYPNPFNPSTKISYSLPVETKVRLQVYSLTGQLIQTLVDKVQSEGFYQVSFDAGNLANGLYIYQLRTGSAIITRKMLFIK